MQRGGTSPGTAWSFSTSRDKGTSDNSLYGVSCGSATSCQAVGDFVNSLPTRRHSTPSSSRGTAGAGPSEHSEREQQHLPVTSLRCPAERPRSVRPSGTTVTAAGLDETLIEKY